MKRSFLAIILILQLFLSAFAQQPTATTASKPSGDPQRPETQLQSARQSDDDVVRITTNLVQVDAVVTDNKGKLVTDLRPEEVEIREDGRPQKVTNFSYFQIGYVVEYGFSIYNAQIEKASGKPNVQFQVRLFRNGQPVFTGKEARVDLTSQPDLRRLRVGGALQLGVEMVPGEYVLQMVVTDLLAKEKRRVVSQWIDFEIIK